MAKKEKAVKTKWNDVSGAPNAWLHEEARKKG